MLQAVCKELKSFFDVTQKLAVKKEILHLVLPDLFELEGKLVKQTNKYTEDGDSEVAKLSSELCKSLLRKNVSLLPHYCYCFVCIIPQSTCIEA